MLLQSAGYNVSTVISKDGEFDNLQLVTNPNHCDALVHLPLPQLEESKDRKCQHPTNQPECNTQALNFYVSKTNYIETQTSSRLSDARPCAKWAEKVLFPTPPFPERIKILLRTFSSLEQIIAMSKKNNSTCILHGCNSISLSQRVFWCTGISSLGLSRGANLLIGASLARVRFTSVFTWCSWTT